MEEIKNTQSEAEKERMEKEFFGERPAYLANGLNTWLEACDAQAKEGIRELKTNSRKFAVFNSGMASYFHQEPKNIGAVEYLLKGMGKFPKDEKLSVKRNFKDETGTTIHTAFKSLFSSNVSDADLEKAGASFYMGTALHDNLKRIADLGAPYIDGLLIWRSKDYDVHRRELTSEEFSSLGEALSARAATLEFAKKIRADYGFEALPESVKNEKKELEELADSAGEKWWTQFCSAIKSQEAKK